MSSLPGWIDGVRGVLLDIDGTLLSGDRAIPGAADCLRRLREAGVAYRLTTNTTRRSRADTTAALRAAGIDVEADAVLQPAVLARRRIVASGRTRAALLVPPGAAADFDGITQDPERPDWVVVGDLGVDFTWDAMNQAFLALRGGAALLALHKNPYWSPEDGVIRIDAGGFVAALEYAAGVTAEVVGKPSPGFFHLALEALGLPAHQVLVVGDDVVNDGRGGAGAGCRTAIVRTGKFRAADLDGTDFRPDLVLDSVKALTV